MENLVHVESIKHKEVKSKTLEPAKQKISPHIEWLEFLRKNGRLDEAVLATIPALEIKSLKSEFIAYMQTKHGVAMIPLSTDGHICISRDDKKKQDREINEYLIHYGKMKAIENDVLRSSLRRRVVTHGEKRFIRSGYFKGRICLILSPDTEYFGGLKWDEAFDSKISEKYMWRTTVDRGLLEGNVFVVKLIDENRDILVNEKEIGDLVL